jgi:hypothetical protein
MEAQLISAPETLKEILSEDHGSALAEHLIRIPGEPWALWRCVCVRSAGFPVKQVLELSSPECAAAADNLLNAQAKLQREQREAVAILIREFETADEAGRVALDKAIRRMKKGKPGALLNDNKEAERVVAAFTQARRQVDSAQTAFLQTFEDSLIKVSRTIQKTSRTKRFREAIIWQNREALHSGIEALLRMPLESTAQRSTRRQREHLVANYLQRYCTKNDTIGFFGPLGWARFVTEGEAVEVSPGPDLVVERNVYFEGWSLDALAAALAKNKNLQPWIAPRAFPFIYFDGEKLHLPFERPVKLPLTFASVLQACDGERTAKEIAADLLKDSSAGLRSEAEVYAVLETLRQKGVISWVLEVPWTLEFPEEQRLEENLRRLLVRIGDEGLRTRMLGALNELEAARVAVAQAAGDDEQLDRALEQLAETFTHLTGSAATRASGKTYAGRTLVYEDCRRDIDLKFGPEILKTLAGPLPLLLASARWFTHEVAATYGKVFRSVYRDLAETSGSPVVDAASFWLMAQPLLFDDKHRLVDTLIPEFQQRWEEILSIPAGLSHIEYDSAQLRSRVLAAFDAPKAGWPYARYHSPDLMIAAASDEAIRRGDYQLVLGELHVGMNTMGSFYFLSQHPAPEDLFRWLEFDIPEIRLVPVTPKTMVTSRNYPVFVSPKDLRLELSRDPSSVPHSKALAIGALVVEEVNGELSVRTRDHSLRFDILDPFADVLSALTINSLKLLRPARHTPRVSFDRLIVCRETWRFNPAEMEFAFEKQEAERFLAARRWARANSLPRFLFVKTPVEVKPTYLDCDSPTLIDMFAKMVRQSAAAGDTASLISMSEMIPNHEQTWLPDAEGHRYTSEFRIVAVDQDR